VWCLGSAIVCICLYVTTSFGIGVRLTMPIAENKSLQSLIDALRIPPDFGRYENLEPAALSSLDEWKRDAPNVLSEIRILFSLRTQGDNEDHKLVRGEGSQDNEGMPPLKELGDIIFAVTPFAAVKFEQDDGEYPWVTLSSVEVAQGTRHSFLPSQSPNKNFPTNRYSLCHTPIHTPNQMPPGPNPNT
jgi:hypothetical protein